jgi:2-polyprenyl-3-methyl-5-hydroxy-6-metoxy-1,4-benzoquinol methylase
LINCPVCNSSSLSYISEHYDDRYGYPGKFKLMRCAGCGHAFLQGEFSPELLRDLYTNYYPRSTFDLEHFQPYKEVHGFSAWFDGEKGSPMRWVPHNVRVLDIGCGFGESLGYHQARGCEVHGVDADENIRRVAEKFGYKVHVGLFDPNVYEPDYFDYVTMNQVIEHVTDPVQTLRGIARALKPGGMAILSTPNARGWGAKVFGRYWINWHAPYHLQFFIPRSMRLSAEQAGLVLEKSSTITKSAWLYYQGLHLISCPPEGKPSVFWASGGKWGRMQNIMVKALNFVDRLKINHVITRFFDALGAGDNMVYFLRKT